MKHKQIKALAVASVSRMLYVIRMTSSSQLWWQVTGARQSLSLLTRFHFLTTLKETQTLSHTVITVVQDRDRAVWIRVLTGSYRNQQECAWFALQPQSQRAFLLLASLRISFEWFNVIMGALSVCLFSETGLLEVMTVDGINTVAHSALVLSPLAFNRSVFLSDWLTDITLCPDDHLTLHLQAQQLCDLDLGDKEEQLIELLPRLLLLLLLLKAREIIMMAAGRNQNWLWPEASEQAWTAGAALKSGE